PGAEAHRPDDQPRRHGEPGDVAHAGDQPDDGVDPEGAVGAGDAELAVEDTGEVADLLVLAAAAGRRRGGGRHAHTPTRSPSTRSSAPSRQRDGCRRSSGKNAVMHTVWGRKLI